MSVPSMQMSVDGWRLESLGEDAVLLRLGGRADAALNRRVHALAGRIAAARPAWLCDIVPAYASLALFVDPAQTGDRYAQDLVGDWLAALPDGGRVAGPQEAPALEIPVCYHPSCAPDLEAVARRAGMPAAELAARHAAGDYRVAMIGFAPGFPYLLGLDPALAAPRHATPRVRVPAGSVGIAGEQTGIYPGDSPGGWQLIGRTPLALFDPRRDPPSLLQPGQRVRFVAVGLDAFTAGDVDGGTALG
ncbi:5-oxoprolinase subunit PxpB [Luteimonas sp. SDU101]|uniref:5-oxoprolinase subunit PxpB n=1 Tax=Luteimonas sp. SDU101 TaxID=3422593 RepID=UPI003EBE4E8E